MDLTDDRLLVGRVARAHGNRGEVIVNLDTDFPDERFRGGQELWVIAAGRSDRRRLESVRFHQGRPVIAMEGVRTMTDAERLAGAELWMDVAGMAPLPPGTFHHHDLVGCDVVDGQGTAIGRVTRVEGPMERSRLVVQAGTGEVLIPLVSEICVAVEPGARRIVVEAPQGLLDVNAAPTVARATRRRRAKPAR